MPQDHVSTIIVTGAAGFIGSCMVQYLNEQGYTNLVIVDDFGEESKRKNWESKQFIKAVERQAFMDWLASSTAKIDAIIHLGARTDTTEFDFKVHEALNILYSQEIWAYCTAQNIPLIYASSAATYGAGENGYHDDHAGLPALKPMNPYGLSKHLFDRWAIEKSRTEGQHPPCWTGLKFFNVYGPNEFHKGRMASVIWHATRQIEASGVVKLFKSHRPAIRDGEQLRDFIYVKDLLKVIYWMLQEMLQGNWQPEKNGIYNLGTGKARSFIDLVHATFRGMDLEPVIQFIDMPEDIRETYQYFTEADMHKLRDAGYRAPFYSLEEGVTDYVRNYLHPVRYY
ncbi:MAG TPA: ADP-glyceromanno-heptose 6-epimerase [Sediminibacterium sp.]|nr:ADP-glyceromanno-heptose 6-epimerase [Sediminibacterium sp.]